MSLYERAAARVLDMVRELSPLGEAEVAIWSTDVALTRFANSFIHQNVAEATTSVRLRLHTAGRTATGSTVIGDSEGAEGALRGLVERTVAAATLSPLDPHWPGLTQPISIPAGPPVDEATAYAEPSARAERVRAFVAAAGGLETAGYCSTARLAMTFANSAGHFAWAETATAAIDGIARDRGSDGVARLVSSRLADLDGAILGTRASAKARAGTDPIELPPGRYEVVLEPTAVLDLLQQLSYYGFNGKSVAEKESFVELGTAQFDPAITILDDPLTGNALPFDVEGSPTPPLTLVDTGRTAAVTHDRRSAAQADTSSTGHAAPGSAAYGAVATHLHLLPHDSGSVTEVDGPAADSAVVALVARVGRGLLVTDNWYTRVLDPRSLIITGLTRNGVWLVEDGQIIRPVRNLRFTQSYPQALAAGAVLGVGSQSVMLPTDWEMETYRAPALHLASWNYTGNASG